LFLEIADGAWRMESEGGSLKLIEIDERRVEVIVEFRRQRDTW
jgi:hypothetical protein